MSTVAIVGAGPAGLRAAEVLVGAGLRPVLIDEAPRVGGQVYRQPPPALRRSAAELYGHQAHRATALLERWSALAPQIEHRPETLVWQIEDCTLHLLQQGRPAVLRPDAMILATGATDRVLPFVGWTLPGVFALGGAQVLLKAQAAVIGPRVVLAGSGPLLVLVAAQLLKAGADVRAVLDVTPRGAWRGALPGLLSRPALAVAGARLLLTLKAAGVPLHRGVTQLRAEGDGRVQQVRASAGGRELLIDADAVAFGHGLRSETQLADLAGCAFDWDPVDEAWLPRVDANGRSSVAGVYLAGDGSGIRGADAAEAAGARAAQALLRDLGLTTQPAAAADPAHDRWRGAMRALTAPPDDWAAQAPDELVVCRCEHLTAGELRACARETGATELNRLKALSRIGMGRCQGRMCGAAAARLLAQASGQPLHAVGRLRAQPPVKPVPIAALAAAIGAPSSVPEDQRDD